MLFRFFWVEAGYKICYTFNMITTEQKLPILKTIPLSLQHLFAMFSATVLVPVFFKVHPGTVLFFNGLGTLIYLIICKGKVPAYLGSSMAFISPVFLVMSKYNYEAALFGFISVGVALCLTSLLIKYIGTKWIDVLFPPAAMGAIVTVIGLELMPIAANMAGLTTANPDNKVIIVSVATLFFTLITTIALKGFMSVISILLSIVFGYILSFFFGMVDFTPIKDAAWFVPPVLYKPQFNINAVMIILPVSLVVIAEHVGHFIVIGNIMGKDLMKDPGLARSIFGNGFSTIISGCFGSTPNTTYGENIGVIALTKIFSPFVIGGAAVFAIMLAFSGKLSAIIQSIPTAVMGGVSLILFGVIATSGIRILVEKKVDYNEPKNLLLTSVVLGIGVSGASFTFGSITIRGMILSTFVAIIVSVLFSIFKKDKNTL